MNLEGLIDAYNLLAVEESIEPANEERAAPAANAALDALDADNPYLDDAIATAIENVDLDGQVALEQVLDERGFGHFLDREREALKEAGLKAPAVEQLTTLIARERTEVVSREVLKPALPQRNHIDSLRRDLREHRSGVIRRIGLVTGGCVAVAVDVLINPEPVTKTLSVIFGGVLIDRGIPEIRHPVIDL